MFSERFLIKNPRFDSEALDTLRVSKGYRLKIRSSGFLSNFRHLHFQEEALSRNSLRFK